MKETAVFAELQSANQSPNLPCWDSTSSYHPADKELAFLANHAYSPNSPVPLSEAWVILATESADNGYNGIAYWHMTRRQLVISHCGTEPPLPEAEKEAQASPVWWNLYGRMYQYVDNKVQTVKEGGGPRNTYG